MKTFILFLYGSFENHEEIEHFCFEIFGVNPLVHSVRFVIENEKNIIVIFDSETIRGELTKELHQLLSIDMIKFYFLFERESLYTANLPVQMKDFIFKPKENESYLRIEYEKDEKEIKKNIDFDLDNILEKIEHLGIDSLSKEEKKFLDNFEK